MIRRLAAVLIAAALSSCGNPVRTMPTVIDAGPPLPRTVCLDNDGDGYAGTGDCSGEAVVDCNDKDALAYPGALELCNALDDNCNGQSDEGLPIVSYYRDEDGDGVGALKVGEGCRAPPMGSVTQSGDCNDQSAAIRPGQAEVCNGADEDCDGTPDNGLPFQDFYLDQDGDGFGSSSSAPVSSCQTSVAGRVTNPGDCNDQNPTIKPGAVELCNKVDDNCDGQLDNGIAYKSYYADTDGDGFGDATAQPESSCSPLPGKVENNADCNDAIATVKPGAPEVCNGADDDCDQQADEGLTFVNYYPDVDGDGFGALGAQAQPSCLAIAGKVTNSTDCNDANPAVKPTAVETCNGIDDNCAGGVDDGLTFADYFPDLDGDGFGAATGAVSACSPIAGRVTTSTDCNDANPAVKPGAPETCNGVDDNCTGQADEGLTFTDYFPDGDGDGHGSSTAGALSSCTPVAGRVTNHDDCNDANASVSPDRTETCNGVDDNCAGGVDEGLPTLTYYPDGDGDGRGRMNVAGVVSCGPVANAVTNNDDCNDTSASIKPGAPELCNGVDDNCDTQVDNGVATQSYYVDNDGDGFGAASSVPVADCAPVAGRVTNNADCNDLNAAIKPSATELCNDLDDDCDLLTDEGLTFLSYYPDLDGDGSGAAGASVHLSCRAVAGKVTNNADCNDSNLAVRPGAAEVCNGIDDNCAGGIDEGLSTLTYYVDADTDGFGASGTTGVASCSAVAGRVANNTDCNDGNSAVTPTAPEACNGVDDNCAGGIDEGNPGGGAACSTGQSGVCGPGTLRCVAAALTCERNVAPGTERCNTLDDDCDGQVDEDFAGLGTTCTAGVGACARAGTNVCNASGTAAVCSATAGSPTAAACDGVDNDCDGVVDEPLLTGTANLGTTAYQDLEVEPYYYSSTSCRGGASDAGSDLLAGGAVLMGVGSSGIRFQPLTTTGAPQADAGTVAITYLSYTDVDFAQAGDGYIVAGVYASNNREIDLYYVNRYGQQRALQYTEFVPATGQTIDSLRVVRGNGRRVSVLFRETDAGIRLGQVEPCPLSDGGWAIRPAGCAATTITSTLLVASQTAPAGLGADSAHVDWAASQACGGAAQRRLGVSYLASPTSVRFFRVDENGANKDTETVLNAATSPQTAVEPDVSFFRDTADQWALAYVQRDPGTTPQADLKYWQTTNPSWINFAWLDYATQNGADSIARPRLSATASSLWLTALRWVNDASISKKQVMTRTIDLVGEPVPPESNVEVPVTFGSCTTDPDCRPGDKTGFTNWAPFGKVFYGASGSTPAGAFTSTLTCN
jgi:hypothetical protein